MPGLDDAVTSPELAAMEAEDSAREAKDAKYGGVVDQVATLVHSGLSGASLGLSDYALKGAGYLANGDAGASSVADYLRETREANPVTAGVGEFAGAIAPALLTEGASTAATAARMTPMGLLARGAGVVEKKALGALGESVASPLARAAIGTGVRGAVENAGMAVGDVLSDDATDTAPLTGERAAMALLGGGALGLGVGGVFGAGGAAAGKAMRALSEVAPKSIGEAIAKIGIRSNPEGAAAFEAAQKDPKVAKAMLHGEETIQDIADKTGVELDQAVKHEPKAVTVSGADVEAADKLKASGADKAVYNVAEDIKALRTEESKVPTYEDFLNTMGVTKPTPSQEAAFRPAYEKLKPPDLPADNYVGSALRNKLAESANELKAIDATIRSATRAGDSDAIHAGMEKARAFMQAQSDHFELLATRESSDETARIFAKRAQKPFKRGADTLDTLLTDHQLFGTAAEEFSANRGLQKEYALAREGVMKDFFSGGELDPSKVRGFARSVMAPMVDAKVQRLEAFMKASEAVGKPLQSLQEQLAWAKQVLPSINYMQAASDELGGGVGAKIAGAVGGPLGAIAGQAVGHPFVGFTIGKTAAKALAGVGPSPQAVVKAIAFFQHLDNKINTHMGASVDRFMKGSSKVGSSIQPLVTRENYFKFAKEVKTDPVTFSGHLANALGEAGTHAPNLTGATGIAVARAISYLASKLPPERTNNNVIGPQRTKSPTDLEIHTLNSHVNGVLQTTKTIEKLGNGDRVSREEVDALKNVYPNAYDDLRQKMIAASDKIQRDMTPSQVTQLSLFFDAPLRQTLDPKYVQFFQGMHAADISASANQATGTKLGKAKPAASKNTDLGEVSANLDPSGKKT